MCSKWGELQGLSVSFVGGGRGGEKKEELLFGKCSLCSTQALLGEASCISKVQGTQGRGLCLHLVWRPEHQPLGRGLSLRGLPWWLSGKESTHQCRRHRFSLWVGKIPWRRKWQPTIDSCWETPGQSSLAGYSSGGRRRVRHDLGTKQQQTLNSEIFRNTL